MIKASAPNLKNNIFSSMKFWPLNRSALVLLPLIAAFLNFPFSANLPNRWSLTQLVCTYQDGCLKRGLLGAALWPLRHLDGARAYSILTSLSWLVSLGVLGSLVLLAGVNVLTCAYRGERVSPRHSRSVTMGSCMGTAAIMIAPTIQFFYHFSGYLDSFAIGALMLGFGLLTYSARCKSPKWLLIILSAIPAVVAVGIHEMAAIAFLPTYIILTLLYLKEHGALPKKSTKFLFFVSVGFSALAAFSEFTVELVIRSFGKPYMPEWLINHRRLADILTPRSDFFDHTFVLKSIEKTFPSLANLGGLSNVALGLVHSLAFVILVMLSFTLILGDTRHSFHGMKKFSKSDHVGCSSWLILCTLSPIALAFVAWDFYRWGSLVTITFLCALSSPQGFRLLFGDWQRLMGLDREPDPIINANYTVVFRSNSLTLTSKQRNFLISFISIFLVILLYFIIYVY